MVEQFGGGNTHTHTELWPQHYTAGITPLSKNKWLISFSLKIEVWELEDIKNLLSLSKKDDIHKEHKCNIS